jgi:uncharacterized membrane protein HdeD (DUF308 family)
VKTFLSDRLNLAWVLSGIVLALVLIFVPNEGAGTFVLIVVAAAAIGITGAARIRDARRDRAAGRRSWYSRRR